MSKFEKMMKEEVPDIPEEVKRSRPWVKLEGIDAYEKANVILKALSQHAGERFFVNQASTGIVRINGRDIKSMDNLIRFQHCIQGEMVLYQESVQEVNKELQVSQVPIDLPPQTPVQSLIEREDWPYLDKVKRIAHFPIFVGKDFQLFNREGYDAKTQTYGMEGMLRLEKMTVEEAKHILIHKLLKDDGGLDPDDPPGFPFVDSSDLANALGMALTPLVLPAIRDQYDNACVPIFLVDASSPGTGKTILAESLLTPELIAKSVPKKEEEFQKVMGSIMGEKFLDVLFFDNVGQGETFGYPTLASMTTQAGRFSMRRLGTNQMIEGRFSGIVVANGNNLQVDADARRRTLLIQLHSSHEEPEKRVCKTNPKAYAQENRHIIHSALVTLVEHWKSKGKPKGSVVMGSFGEFTRVVGGILDAAGVHGFAGNADRLKERVNDHGWAEFTAIIGAEFEAGNLNPNGLSAKKLYEHCENAEIATPTDVRGVGAQGWANSFGVRVGEHLRGPRNIGGWMWENLATETSKRTSYRVSRYIAPDME
ncbi:hypothetical protein FRD01_13655 [Microvenator marinus]|uniref:Uncharacterized protein n=1 Tax=Microvenator marinus TaxID=2600177 RepID=A0A5B8XWY0_9DELT|nr:hypothetical protein [Microvenator marinus]QED28256.1 hypothetical protein FRD01_13655 [Microvenator marinus]